MTLRRIDRNDVRRICAQQALADLAAVAKELVENSIDAGATSIDVRVFEQGADGIEVSDNGCGIPESDFESLAKHHHTSKITAYDNIHSTSSFGFRGEALHAMSTISKLVVTTSTEETAPLGHRLEYSPIEETVNQSRVARARGTTIQVTDLFGTLPVRAREFKRQIRKEYSKCIEMMQMYAASSVGIKFSMSNITSKGTKSVLIQTLGANTIRDNATAVFGASFTKSVLDLRFEFPFSGADLGDDKLDDRNKAPTVVVSGMISKPQFGFGRSARDRQLIFVNRRPVDLPKIARAITEAYHGFVQTQYPMFIFQINLSPNMYDVNLTPDKRTLAIENEALLAQNILDGVTKSLQPLRGHFDGSIATLALSQGSINSSQGSNSNTANRVPRSASTIQTVLDKTRLEPSDTLRSSAIGGASNNASVYNNTIPELIHADHEDPVLVNMNSISRRHASFSRRQRAPDRLLRASLDGKMSETTFVHKTDFSKMEIIGQFNLGFIIVKRDRMLFIVDQHASDEKYRYEMLQRTAITTFQPLMQPIELRLTPQQESFVLQKRESLRERGFVIDCVAQSGDDEASSTDHAKLHLVSVPQIRDLHLGLTDLEEILSRAEPSAFADVPHCSRVQRYFASKACRGSVMIGDALTRHKMRDILDNMGRIEQPWNCPHGRPTMRLLAVLTV